MEVFNSLVVLMRNSIPYSLALWVLHHLRVAAFSLQWPDFARPSRDLASVWTAG